MRPCFNEILPIRRSKRGRLHKKQVFQKTLELQRVVVSGLHQCFRLGEPVREPTDSTSSPLIVAPLDSKVVPNRKVIQI